ncbi:hypothetical protein [Mariniflexile sp. HMF6888]|uniref:hypothetical protein n=1 Tax=Mariniflexile sp. HMF6888 TaxID=3373086 RepID=UPI0037876E6B
MKPEDLIDKQLEFYNKNLLDLFCNTYSDNIEIFDLKSGKVILSGKKELYEKYDFRFNVQKVQTKIINRIIIGNSVIDQEEVSGIKENEIVKAVAIYEIENDLIKTVKFIFE